jgi:hypothetical protein
MGNPLFVGFGGAAIPFLNLFSLKPRRPTGKMLVYLHSFLVKHSRNIWIESSSTFLIAHHWTRVRAFGYWKSLHSLFPWNNSILFSAFSFTLVVEIGHRNYRPVDECPVEKWEGLGGENISRTKLEDKWEKTPRLEKHTQLAFYTILFRWFDRMSLFTRSHLL